MKPEPTKRFSNGSAALHPPKVVRFSSLLRTYDKYLCPVQSNEKSLDPLLSLVFFAVIDTGIRHIDIIISELKS